VKRRVELISAASTSAVKSMGKVPSTQIVRVFRIASQNVGSSRRKLKFSVPTHSRGPKPSQR
jgi:hypothetical protein